MRKNSGMWKTISRKEKLRRVLLIIFGAGVIALAGVSYQYVKNAVPDRINVVVDRQEQVRFGLPFRALLESESEEVLLNGSSKIPSDQIHLQLNQPFSIYSEQEGTYRLSLKLFGIWKLKDIEVDVSDVQYAVPCGLPVGSDGSGGRNPAFWRLYRGNQRDAGDGQERYDTGGQGSGKYGSDTFSAPRGRDDGCTDDAGTDAGGRL